MHLNVFLSLLTLSMPWYSSGMIHVSQETANELVAHGKETWVRKRPDMVEAKGKGIMQTYYVSVNSNGDTAKTLESTRSGTGSEKSDAEMYPDDELELQAIEKKLRSRSGASVAP